MPPPYLSHLLLFFIDTPTALKITSRMIDLNQKGKKIVGVLLNILHEIFIPPKIENGSSTIAPKDIKKSLSDNNPIPSFRLSSPPSKKDMRHEYATVKNVANIDRKK